MKLCNITNKTHKYTQFLLSIDHAYVNNDNRRDNINV